MAGLGPMHGQAHHFVRYAPEPIPYALDRYRNEARRLLAVMDRRLGEADYLAGEYSIADMACWPWVRAAQAIDIATDDFGALRRWYDRIGERPAIQQGATVPSESAQLRPGEQHIALNETQWSNIFGRNMLAAAGLKVD
jgi:GST-like protein